MRRWTLETNCGVQLIRALLFAVAMLCAANGDAQSRAFAEGAIAVRTDGGGMRRNLGVGVNVSSRFDLRFEAEFAAWDVSRDAGCGSHACLELNYATRAESIAFLLGGHFNPASRVRVDIINGFGVLTNGLHATGYFDTLAADRTIANHFAYDDRSAEHFAEFIFGLDVPLLVTKHFAVVPQFRIHAPIGVWYASGFGSTGVAMRWQF